MIHTRRCCSAEARTTTTIYDLAEPLRDVAFAMPRLSRPTFFLFFFCHRLGRRQRLPGRTRRDPHPPGDFLGEWVNDSTSSNLVDDLESFKAAIDAAPGVAASDFRLVMWFLTTEDENGVRLILELNYKLDTRQP